MSTTQKITISQPPEWIEAFRLAADRDGMTLSEWIGESCFAQLPSDIQASLPVRVTRGRPKLEGK